jgi:hypothetical protein
MWVRIDGEQCHWIFLSPEERADFDTGSHIRKVGEATSCWEFLNPGFRFCDGIEIDEGNTFTVNSYTMNNGRRDSCREMEEGQRIRMDIEIEYSIDVGGVSATRKETGIVTMTVDKMTIPTEPICSDIPDGLCDSAAGCSNQNDADCCIDDGFQWEGPPTNCCFVPGWGCL